MRNTQKKWCLTKLFEILNLSLRLNTFILFAQTHYRKKKVSTLIQYVIHLLLTSL